MSDDATQPYTTDETQTTTTTTTTDDTTQLYDTEEEAPTQIVEETNTQETQDPDATQAYTTEEEQPTTTETTTTQGYVETDLFGDASDDEKETTEEAPAETTEATTTTTETQEADEEQPMPTDTGDAGDAGDDGDAPTQADLFGDLSDDEKETIEPESTTATGDEDVSALTQADMDDAAMQEDTATDEQQQQQAESETTTSSQKRSTSVIKKHRLVAQGDAQTVQTRPIQGPPRDADLLLVKLPNVVGIEANMPFDTDTYERQLPLEIVEDRLGDRHFNPETNVNTPGVDRRVIRLAAENVIRWRWVRNQDGVPVKQSNARIVRWSDGSSQLFLGNEVFEVVERDIENKRNQIFANVRNKISKAQGVLKRTIKFRPLGVTDAAHKKLGDLIAQTHIKQGKLKRQLEPVDIEKMKAISEQAAKSADAKASAARKKAQQHRRETTSQNKKLDSSFIENEEDAEYDYSETMKRDYDDDDERSRRLMRAKSKRDDADDDEEAHDDDDDEDETSKRKRKHEDEEPEEEEPVMKKPSKGKRRKLAEDEEGSDED